MQCFYFKTVSALNRYCFSMKLRYIGIRLQLLKLYLKREKILCVGYGRAKFYSNILFFISHKKNI